MKKRTPLRERLLPAYSRGLEIANMVTHIIGGAIGIFTLIAAILISVAHHNVWGIVSGSVYGASLICLFSVSSIYHGLRPNLGKKVMQVIDHCTIYFLIAGTYTPILLSAVRTQHPAVAWAVFAAEWALAATAVVFTAIDHHKYSKFSMACYIGMGWLVVLALKPTVEAIGTPAFLLILLGGMFYTVGAVIYGLGKKKHLFLHVVFHVLVDVGCALQAAAILGYIL